MKDAIKKIILILFIFVIAVFANADDFELSLKSKMKISGFPIRYSYGIKDGNPINVTSPLYSFALLQLSPHFSLLNKSGYLDQFDTAFGRGFSLGASISSSSERSGLLLNPLSLLTPLMVSQSLSLKSSIYLTQNEYHEWGAGFTLKREKDSNKRLKLIQEAHFSFFLRRFSATPQPISLIEQPWYLLHHRFQPNSLTHLYLGGEIEWKSGSLQNLTAFSVDQVVSSGVSMLCLLRQNFKSLYWFAGIKGNSSSYQTKPGYFQDSRIEFSTYIRSNFTIPLSLACGWSHQVDLKEGTQGLYFPSYDRFRLSLGFDCDPFHFDSKFKMSARIESDGMTALWGSIMLNPSINHLISKQEDLTLDMKLSMLVNSDDYNGSFSMGGEISSSIVRIEARAGFSFGRLIEPLVSLSVSWLTDQGRISLCFNSQQMGDEKAFWSAELRD